MSDGLPTLREELWKTIRLALPITAGMLSQMLLGLADTAMVGQLGVIPLAACSLVNALVHIPMVLAIGILSSVGVLSANAFGAKKDRQAGEVLRHGLFLAVLSGIGTFLMALVVLPFLGHLGQDPKAVEAAGTYYLLFSASILPAMIAHTAKQYCESLEHPWIANGILFAGVVLNILFNWILIYGNWGAPVLGLNGAGWATVAARTLTALALLLIVAWLPSLKPFHPVRWLAWVHRETLGQLWRIGLPSGIQHLLEVGAFVFTAIMMGWISASALAAHQIAINCAATTFMMMLGLAIAVCIRIGHAEGAGEYQRVRRIGFSGQALAGIIMLGFAVVFIFQNDRIAGFFTQDPALLEMAAGLIIIAAVFQLADGMQVVGINALRGMKDVNKPAGIALVAYWLITVPLAWWLGFETDLGAKGIWYGLAIGLFTAAITFTLRFEILTRREIKG